MICQIEDRLDFPLMDVLVIVGLQFIKAIHQFYIINIVSFLKTILDQRIT